MAEDPDGAIIGVARLAADPDGSRAEFALMVRTDQQARGLGHALLTDALAYAQARGVKTVWGEIERSNSRMLSLAADLGFVNGPASEAELVRATRTF